jgi:hypothetical protein
MSVQIETLSKRFVGCRAVTSRGVQLFVVLSLLFFAVPLVFAISPGAVSVRGGLAPPIGITLTAALSPGTAEPRDQGYHVITFQVRDDLVLLRVQKVRFSVANLSRLAFLQAVKPHSPSLRFRGSDQLAQAIVEAAQQNRNVTLKGRWYANRRNFFVADVRVLDEPAL